MSNFRIFLVSDKMIPKQQPTLLLPSAIKPLVRSWDALKKFSIQRLFSEIRTIEQINTAGKVMTQTITKII